MLPDIFVASFKQARLFFVYSRGFEPVLLRRVESEIVAVPYTLIVIPEPFSIL